MTEEQPSRAFLRRLWASWEFYRDHFTLAIAIGVVGTAMVLAGLLLHDLSVPGTFYEQVLVALGTGLLITASFNVAYEVKTRDSFRQLLAQIVPTLASGVVVHHNHRAVLAREKALRQFLRPGECVRIITSTADNYFKKGEASREALEAALRDRRCSLRVLLYLPVFERWTDSSLGQRQRSPQQLILEQIALFEDYADVITIDPLRIQIRFFTRPLHVNFVMIGGERMYSAPIMHSIHGIDLPCFEIAPVGTDSLFHKFQRDFDTLFGSEDRTLVLDFEAVRELYEQGHHSFEEICHLFLEEQLLHAGAKTGHVEAVGNLPSAHHGRPPH